MPAGPEIGKGAALTKMGVVVRHPVGSVYVTVAVPPDMPVTTPAGFIVATVDGVQLQVPPPSNNEVVVPAHKVVVPEIVAGSGFTDILNEEVHPDTEE